jgi:hypothetical protein
MPCALTDRPTASFDATTAVDATYLRQHVLRLQFPFVLASSHGRALHRRQVVPTPVHKVLYRCQRV